MIRYRRAVPFASGTAASLFGPAWKFRVVVSCPPGETVAVRPVRESSPKDPYVFGPGDSGWITFNVLHSGILIEKQSGASTASVDVWWADERTDEVHIGAALVTSPIGNVIYDSGAVAGGVAIDSGVLDLSTLTNIEVIVDNTAGGTFRPLSMLTYLADGATQIDTALLRSCLYGPLNTGHKYAPGLSRCMIGPAPLSASGWLNLYDRTGAVGAALDSGLLNTSDQEQIVVYWTAAGGNVGQNALNMIDDNGVSLALDSSVIAQPSCMSIMGPGVFNGTSFLNGPVALHWASYPVFPLMNATAAASAGVTQRIRVWARGRVPGTFAHQIALPPRAKFTLGAGGVGAARLTVLGR